MSFVSVVFDGVIVVAAELWSNYYEKSEIPKLDDIFNILITLINEFVIIYLISYLDRRAHRSLIPSNRVYGTQFSIVNQKGNIVSTSLSLLNRSNVTID